MNLKNKPVLITGGAMGIGLATCRRLVKEGSVITIWDLNEQALKSAKDELTALGGNVYTYICDITDKKRVYELAKQAEKDMGKVDILINNAGYMIGGNFLDQPDEKWERMIDVNLTSLLYTIRAFMPGMLERNSGHIVNLSSAAGTLGVSGLAVYCATKWAVWGLTESLRHEAWNINKKGVRFSTIHPNFIVSGMFEGSKINGLGGIFFPNIKDHDVVAKAIVESALKRGRLSPKRPLTIKISSVFRGIFPDFIFQKIVRFFGVHKSMESWKGR